MKLELCHTVRVSVKSNKDDPLHDSRESFYIGLILRLLSISHLTALLLVVR